MTVQFISRNDDANTLRWAINVAAGKELWGELAPSGQSVALDGDAHDVPLTSETSVDELTRPFVLQP